MTTGSGKAVIAALDDHMSDFIVDMMRQEFEIDVALLKDPETDEVEVQNIDGSPISEGQYFALAFFERGWFAAIRSIETLAERFDRTGEIGYSSENDPPPGEETE
jgi:hypothetical protein